MIKLSEEIDKSTLLVVDFNTALSVINLKLHESSLCTEEI